jgi:Spy/CpxP family protein refolding chaperone
VSIVRPDWGRERQIEDKTMTEQNKAPSLAPAVAAKGRRSVRALAALALAGLIAGGAVFFSAGQSAFADRGPGMERMGHGGRGEHGHGSGMMGGGMMGMMTGRHLDRMLDRVDATDEQRAKIRDISRAARNDVEKLTDVLQPMRKSAVEALAAPTVDRATVEGLRTRLSGVTDEISKRMTTAMLDVAQVLTPEQRAKIAEDMNARRRGHSAK